MAPVFVASLALIWNVETFVRDVTFALFLAVRLITVGDLLANKLTINVMQSRLGNVKPFHVPDSWLVIYSMTELTAIFFTLFMLLHQYNTVLIILLNNNLRK